MKNKILTQWTLWLLLFLSNNCFGQNKLTRHYRDIKIESQYIRNCETGKGVCLPIQVIKEKNEGVKLIFPIGGTQSDVSLYERNVYLASIKGLKEPEPIAHVGARIGQKGKFELDVSELNDGTYIVDYSSCHWGGTFSIVVSTKE